MSSKYDNFMKRLSLPNRNREIFFLSLLLLFAVTTRLIPFAFITIVSVGIVLLIIGLDFYFYANKKAKDENKNEKTTEFSWGFVKEKQEMLDLGSLMKYLTTKDFSFYKSYLMLNINKITVTAFLFGDLIVAFKNLELYYAGIYIALSLFTKFVFVGYLLMRQSYAKVLVGDRDTEENILDIFYSQMNGLISVFAVVFIFFFILSRYMVEIFFGKLYLPYQSSLPFVLLANISLAIAICVYTTAKRIDPTVTNMICKVYITIFALLFIFMSINYIDTITYFVIGSSTILSIFLYNFVIKKPKYIADTYNLLF